MNVTVKAKIETVRIVNGGEIFDIQVSFPEFKGPAGDSVSCNFETSLEAYLVWDAPEGVDKSPLTYIEYEFVRPTYTKLKTLHTAIENLNGKEFDW